MRTLYGKDSKGELRVWTIYTEDAEVVVRHGKLNGKIQEKRYSAGAKNSGKANATTPSEQAVVEAEAKYVKQLKSGYFHDQTEALGFEEFTPMRAHNYKDFAGKVKYPCYMQPKLNGQRLMIDKNGVAWSKQGEPLELPRHWTGVKEFAIKIGGLDGEVYAGLESEGGLSLQKIISAFRKPNADTPKLQYYVYDIPSSEKQHDRLNTLEWGLCISPPETIKSAGLKWVDTSEVGDKHYEIWSEQGYEGAIYRNCLGRYEFGKRSYDLIKRKPVEDFEARVLSVEKDKNDCGVLTCEVFNGKAEGSIFKCLMRKDADENINYREYGNSLKLIGKLITVEMECLSDDNVPLKPIGIALRETLNGTLL